MTKTVKHLRLLKSRNADNQLSSEARTEIEAHYVGAFDDRGYVVETHHLYPSYAHVEISIHQNGNEFEVSDMRGGILEIISHGISTAKPGTWLGHYARRWGVDYFNGRVFIVVKNEKSLPKAIASVATASSFGAARMIEEFRFPTEFSYAYQFSEKVAREFNNRFKHRKVMGLSKAHSLDYVSARHTDRVLEDAIEPDTAIVIDPVFPHEAAIANKAMIHRDILKRAENINSKQFRPFLVWNEKDKHWDEGGRRKLLESQGLSLITFTEMPERIKGLLRVIS